MTNVDENLTLALQGYKAAVEVFSRMKDSRTLDKARSILAIAAAEEVKVNGPTGWGETWAYSYKPADPELWKLYREECKKILTTEALTALEAQTAGVDRFVIATKETKHEGCGLPGSAQQSPGASIV